MTSEPWIAEKVERRAVARIKLNPKNARKHSAEQVGQIGEAIKRFGFTRPLLIDGDDMIIAGEGRFLGAKAVGWKDVPVVVCPPSWSDEDKRLYALADNKIGLNSEWDQAALSFEIGDLGDMGMDLSIAGFSDAEVAKATREEKSEVKEVETDTVDDRFWISIRGPLAEQARVIDAIKAAIGQPGEIEIDLGTVMF